MPFIQRLLNGENVEWKKSGKCARYTMGLMVKIKIILKMVMLYIFLIKIFLTI